MADDIEAVKETAKAVQEVSKLGARSIDAVSDFGSWIARVIGGPLDEAAGIVQDKLAFIRAKNRLRFRCEYERLKNPVETRAIPANLGIPLIQSGMLEDDEELQDLWVAMLANATDPNAAAVRRSYVAILQQLDPVDLVLFRKLYQVETDSIKSAIPTYGLPDAVHFGEEVRSDSTIPVEVEISLRNLLRAGLLDSAIFWSGAKSLAAVHQSPLGWAILRACSRKPAPAA